MRMRMRIGRAQQRKRERRTGNVWGTGDAGARGHAHARVRSGGVMRTHLLSTLDFGRVDWAGLLPADDLVELRHGARQGANKGRTS